MRLSHQEARRRLAGARVMRLATVGPDGAPHLVPATFAVRGGEIVTAVDHKPKRRQDLRRLRNMVREPRVCVLADEYAEDWSRLWWVRADGLARVLPDAQREGALAELAAKYPQYTARRPDGPVVAITVTRWTGWSSAADGRDG